MRINPYKMETRGGVNRTESRKMVAAPGDPQADPRSRPGRGEEENRQLPVHHEEYYSDEAMAARFQAEPPNESVLGLALPKTNGVGWFTPKDCPRLVAAVFWVVAWTQTALLAVWPALLLWEYGLFGAIRLPLLVPLGSLMEAYGPNRGTAYASLTVLYAASRLATNTMSYEDSSPFALTAGFLLCLFVAAHSLCHLENKIGRSVFAALVVYIQFAAWALHLWGIPVR